MKIQLPNAPITVMDFETFSEVDVTVVGGWRYAEDESTEPLCMTYGDGHDESPVQLWLPDEDPPDFLYDEDRYFVAHNAEFEIAIWSLVMCKKYGWPKPPPLERWIDTAAVCRYYAYPGKLEIACKALGLLHTKNEEGHRIMKKLSRPRKPSKANPDRRWTPETKPEDFEKLYEYGIDDTEAERELLQTLGILPSREQLVWQMNAEMNIRGVPADPELAKQVLAVKDYHMDKINEEVSRITKGKITKTTQTKRLTDYLKVKSLARDDLEKMLPNVRDKKKKRLIELRLAGSRSSTAKFEKLLLATMKDGMLRGMQIYHTATTGRFGGAIIQPHNLPRPKHKEKEIKSAVNVLMSSRLTIPQKYKKLRQKHDDLMELFMSLVRSALKAPKGKAFAVSDFESVEARGLAWAANELATLQQFRKGLDPYLEMASDIYERKITEKGDERNLGKACILGAGYGMTWKTFQGTCSGYGLDISDELSQKAIKTFRETRKAVCEFWYAINQAMIDCLKQQRKIKCMCVEFDIIHDPVYAITIKLPSGKKLFYPEPWLEKIEAPWDHNKMIDQVFFMSLDIKTQKWVESSTYGSKVVENIIQALSRELLIEAMYKVRKRKLPIVLTIHDEIVALVRMSKAKKAYKLLTDIMSKPPRWARTLPLGADGYIDIRYKKG